MSPRAFLIHWNAAEADEIAAPLRSRGWSVEVEAKDGSTAYRRIMAERPDAVLISLARLPSHGRETAKALLAAGATRNLPIIFFGGAEEAVAKTRASVAGAQFVSPEQLIEALDKLAQG